MENKSLYVKNSSANLGEKFLDANKTTTIYFYVKLIDNVTEQVFIAQNVNGTASNRTEFMIKNKKAACFVGNSGTVYGKNEVPTDKWVNFAYVINKNNIKLYIDGELEIDREISSYYNDNTWLFSYERGSRYFLNAYIDEFRIYDYAMTQEELQAKLGKKEYDYSHLLRYYNFDEVKDGNIIPDLTGNYDLKINNFQQLSDDIPEFLEYKFLLKQNNQYYTFNGSDIILSPSQELNQDNFINEGFSKPSDITEEQWNNAFSDKTGLKLLMWTEDLDKTEIKAECEIEPFTPYDKLENKFEICMATEKEGSIS